MNGDYDGDFDGDYVSPPSSWQWRLRYLYSHPQIDIIDGKGHPYYSNGDLLFSIYLGMTIDTFSR